MKAKRGALILVLAAMMVFSAVLVPFVKAAGEPAQCGINSFNITPVGTIISTATQVYNWTVTIATSNSSILNVTNVTIFRNDTRVIICQNLSLTINSTTTNNCTGDSTGQTDLSNLVVQVEAYEQNRTGGTERCTNISFLNGITINNTVPTFSKIQPDGTTFYGLAGASINNISAGVDASVVNCTFWIGTYGANKNSVITPVGGNVTYQPTIADGFTSISSYPITWNCTDGLDYRVQLSNFIISLASDKSPTTPTLQVAQAVGQQQANSKNRWIVGGFIVILFAMAMFYGGNKK